MVEARLGAVRNGIRFRGIQIDTDAREISVDGEPVTFAKTEYELLKLFLENRGRVFSCQELLDAVWPNDVIVTNQTVDVTVARIRRKIGLYSANLQTHAGSGYSFQD